MGDIATLYTRISRMKGKLTSFFKFMCKADDALAKDGFQLLLRHFFFTGIRDHQCVVGICTCEGGIKLVFVQAVQLTELALDTVALAGFGKLPPRSDHEHLHR